MSDPQPQHHHAPLPLSNGRLKQIAEHPVGKLLERIGIALVTFLAVWQFNAIHEMSDELARMRGDQQAAQVRLERAEQDIQQLWNRRGRRGGVPAERRPMGRDSQP